MYWAGYLLQHEDDEDVGAEDCEDDDDNHHENYDDVDGVCMCVYVCVCA